MTASDAEPCRGRFAPSPSGPLHLGSIITAVGSWLDARSRGGQWLLRIEDIDPQRERPGAGNGFLRELERLHLHWDGPVLRQSTRRAAHRAALEHLLARGLAYACGCSRREVGAAPYPGTCRLRPPPPGRPVVYRLRVNEAAIGVDDRLQGWFEQTLSATSGDFVIWRADDWPAYHLAVVVDDAWQGVTDIVRGADLLDSTPRQIFLQRVLELPTPDYAHLPLALEADGSKLSKQSAAHPVGNVEPVELLTRALRFLGHTPPAALEAAGVEELLDWAVGAWRLEKVPKASRRP